MNILTDIILNPDLVGHASGQLYLKIDASGKMISTANVEETDPTVPSYVKAITSGQINTWDQAYGWGNHAGLYYTKSEHDLRSIRVYKSASDGLTSNDTTGTYIVAKEDGGWLTGGGTRLAGSHNGYGVISMRLHTGSYDAQIHLSAATQDMAIRFKNNADWTTLRKVWHEGNFIAGTHYQAPITNPVTGTGVNGQVAFWNGTGTQTGDSGFTWDNVNKRLSIISAGIGSLFVQSSIRSDLFLTDTGAGVDLKRLLLRSDGGVLKIGAENDAVNDFRERITVNLGWGFGSSPNVIGILTTSPTETIDVNGSARIRTLYTTQGDFVQADANGVLSRRTASQVLTQIGAQPAGNYVTTDTTQTISGQKTFTDVTRIGSTQAYNLMLQGGFLLKDYTNPTGESNGCLYYDNSTWYFRGGGINESVVTSNTSMAIYSGGAFRNVYHDSYHPEADKWTTARTLTIGNTGKAVDGTANVSWSLAEIGAQPAGSYAAASHSHPASEITAGTFAAGDFTFQNALQVNGNNIRFASAKRTLLHNGHMYIGDIDNIGGNLYIRQAGIDVAYASGYNWTLPYDLTVVGKISDVKGKLNTFYNNLGNPMIEEYALIHGQMNNKLRFLVPIQEESVDGVTWTTSTRASANQLGDMMRGEGEGTSFSAIPAPALGGTGYYRLTWNASQTGYVALNKLYVYCSTSGNQVEFTIERKHNTTGWETLTSGTLGNWPGHIFCNHSTIWFNPSNASQYGEVRVSFRIVSAAYTNAFTLYAIEWFGGYPAGKRNVESYDRDKNVTFPNAITGTSFKKTGGAASQFLKADGSVDSNSYSLSSHNHDGVYVPISGASYIQSLGRQTAWGSTNGTSTGAFNALMGTSSNATWLLSGTSNGVFRAGIQALDSNGTLRFYVGANHMQFDGTTITGASLSGNASTATNLQTARTLTIGLTGKSFSGAANVSWSLAEIGAQAAGNYVTTDTTQTISGQKTFTNTSLQLSGHLYRGMFGATEVYDHYYPNGGNGSNHSFANLRVHNGTGSPSSYRVLRFGGDGTFTWDGSKVWHQGNDGSGSGLDADLLDGIDSGSFLRSDADDTFTGRLSVGSTNARNAGIYGIYDSSRIGHIWSMGIAYAIANDGSTFGSLYGMAYKHTNNTTGGTMAGGHQIVFANAGVPGVSIGLAGTIWTNSHGTSADWKQAYDWGNHAGLYMLRSSGAQSIDPNTLFNSSAYRIEPHVNSPENTHFSYLTYGNQGNVTAQLATRIVTGETYIRAYNTAWSAWRKVWDSVNFDPNSKANASHIHSIADITDLASQLSEKASANHSHTWDSVTQKPTFDNRTQRVQIDGSLLSGTGSIEQQVADYINTNVPISRTLEHNTTFIEITDYSPGNGGGGGSVQPGQTNVAPQNLQLYYDFGATDWYVGNTNTIKNFSSNVTINGDLIGGLGYYSDFGGYMKFLTSSSNFIRTNQGQLTIGLGGNSTIVFVARAPYTGSDNFVINAAGYSGIGTSLHCGFRNNFFLKGHYGDDYSGGSFVANQWYHVVFTYNLSTSTTTLYVNGALIGSGNQGPLQVDHGLYVARWQNGHYDLDLGLLMIYNTQLGQADVTTLYTEQRTRFGI